MRNLTIGIIIGMMIGGGVAWAAAKGIVWVDGGNNAMGTATNPVYIQSI